jgi:uncharacterized protein YgfB (UPF0149 family)
MTQVTHCDAEQLSQQLAQAGVPMSAAEVHGIACGLLCGLAEDVQGHWHQALYSELDENDVLVQECRNATDILMDVTAEQLRDTEAFSFDLCLPDEEDVPAYAGGLRDWCQGFLYGFGVAAEGSHNGLTEEGDEALKDMSEISKLDVDAVQGGEEEAAALAEVEEYLKIAALTVRQDRLAMQQQQGKDKQREQRHDQH